MLHRERSITIVVPPREQALKQNLIKLAKVFQKGSETDFEIAIVSDVREKMQFPFMGIFLYIQMLALDQDNRLCVIQNKSSFQVEGQLLHDSQKYFGYICKEWAISLSQYDSFFMNSVSDELYRALGKNHFIGHEKALAESFLSYLFMLVRTQTKKELSSAKRMEEKKVGCLVLPAYGFSYLSMYQDLKEKKVLFTNSESAIIRALTELGTYDSVEKRTTSVSVEDLMNQTGKAWNTIRMHISGANKKASDHLLPFLIQNEYGVGYFINFSGDHILQK